MRTIIFLSIVLVLSCFFVHAQPVSYTPSNAHSHNDYQNADPFHAAFTGGFGSIEADIFLYHDSLVVGHTMDDLHYRRTLENLYLTPLLQQVKLNNGYPNKDSTKELQLLIDVKTEPLSTLQKLINVLKNYPLLISSPGIKFVISGNKPDPDSFTSYPAFIWFDGELNKVYAETALTKIAMLSGDFKNYSSWNGKGTFTGENKALLDSMVSKVHQQKKKIRFWNSPDFVNAWYQFMNLRVDYINTDHIKELSSFLLALPAVSYTLDKPYAVYEPTYKTDGTKKTVKNIILFIGDGTALPQLYAGYTANHASLNIFKMKNIGISKTSSCDSYVIDSAAGATCIAAGVETNNHYVGVGHSGAALKLLPVYLQKKKIKTGLVTCGYITDATPADFCAHEKDRENSKTIIRDFKNAPIDILMGSGNEGLENVKLFNDGNWKPFNDTIIKELEPEYAIISAVAGVPAITNKKWIVVEKRASLSILNGRGDWLMEAFSKPLDVLSKNNEFFFMMTEAAQVDYGGHDNNISYVAVEVADFDKVVGKALAFADQNGQTLVLVTADLETGGLTLLEGDYSKGYVSGRFSAADYTALPLTVFAYGPGSERFCGVYENTGLFKKIMYSFRITIK